MKLKNKEIKGIVNVIFNLGNRQTIREKWELTKYMKPFIDLNNMLQNEINQIIQNEGKDGSLSTSNQNYQSLMECETEINAEYLLLEKIEKMNPSMDELSILIPIIKEVE